MNRSTNEKIKRLLEFAKYDVKCINCALFQKACYGKENATACLFFYAKKKG